MSSTARQLYCWAALVALAVLSAASLRSALCVAPGSSVFIIPNDALYPTNVALDSAGNVYTTNAINNTVVILHALTAVAPLSLKAELPDLTSPVNYPFGVALDSADNMYVADCGNSRVVVLAPLSSAVLPPGTELFSFTDNGTLSCPASVALDLAGNIYLSDVNNNRVVVLAAIDSSSPAPGSQLFSFDPTGDSYSGFDGPIWTALDAIGNLYVMDSYNGRVVVLAAISSATPGVELFSFFTYYSYEFSGAEGISVNPFTNNIYVADSGNNRVVVLAGIDSVSPPPGTQIAVLIDQTRRLQYPLGGMAFDSNNHLYVADDNDGRIAVLTDITAVSPMPDTEVANYQLPQHPFYDCYGLDLDAAGNGYVADPSQNTITVFASLQSANAGSYLYVFNNNNSFNGVVDVSLDKAGNLYAADENNARVVVLAAITSATPGALLHAFQLPPGSLPHNIAFDLLDNFYVTDTATGNITVFSALTSSIPGAVLSVFTDVTTPFGSSSIRGIALDATQNVYVCDYTNGRLVVLAALDSGLPAGTELFSFTGPAQSSFDTVAGVTLDSQGRIYVANSQDHVTVLAAITSSTPGATLNVLYDDRLLITEAKDVVLDKAGNMYITDPNDGVVHVLAGLSNTGTALGDPQFTGFLGQSYQVHGLDGAVYSILSSASLQVNARFTFLLSGTCPTYANRSLPAAANCWSHPGSYFGAFGLRTSSGSWLRIDAGQAQAGFQAITMDGRDLLPASRQAELTGQPVVVQGDELTARLLDRHHMIVSHGIFSLALDNSDRFMNLAEVRITSWSALVDEVRPHGLLGQSWRRRPAGQRRQDLAEVEGAVDDYLDLDGDILGNNNLFSRFRSAPKVSMGMS